MNTNPQNAHTQGLPNTLFNSLAKALAEHPVVRFAVIYGSAAEGRLRPDSDVDLGVAGHRPLTFEERLELATQLEHVAGRTVDVVDLTAANGLILKEALVGRTPILNREPDMYAGLVKRMLLDEEDFGPLRRMVAESQARRFAHGA